MRRVVDGFFRCHVALAHLGEGRCFVAVDGDEELLGVEAVHLDESVVVGDGAVDDDEDEVVVVVELRALAELLGVLDRERVELEDVAQDRVVVLVGWSTSIQKKESPARSFSTFSRLKCISSLPRSWMTVQVFGGVRPASAAESSVGSSRSVLRSNRSPPSVVHRVLLDRRRGRNILFEAIPGARRRGESGRSLRPA